MHATRDYTLFASGARYQTTNGSCVDVGAANDLVLVLNVSKITGAPTSLDVSIQGSYDGTNFGAFKTAIAFTQVTSATGVECLQVTNFGGRFIRAVATIVGGESGAKEYTFSVYAHGKSIE